MNPITTAPASSFPFQSSASAAATAADLFAELEQRVQSTQSNETTVQTPGGGSVTTVPGSDGPRIVSETNAQGETLTEVGYVSPTLLHNFLSSLFSSLNADGSRPAAAASTGGTGGASANASAATDPVTSSVQALIAQLKGSGGTNTAGLLQSFQALLQNSGMSPNASGDMTSAQASQTLQAFLTSALPALKSGELNRTGFLLNTTA